MIFSSLSRTKSTLMATLKNSSNYSSTSISLIFSSFSKYNKNLHTTFQFGDNLFPILDFVFASPFYVPLQLMWPIICIAFQSSMGNFHSPRVFNLIALKIFWSAFYPLHSTLFRSAFLENYSISVSIWCYSTLSTSSISLLSSLYVFFGNFLH